MKQAANIFIFIFTIPIFTFGQTNYKDELGRKQGLHIDTVKHNYGDKTYKGYKEPDVFGGLIEATYLNDTLHGLYKRLDENGKIMWTGYYKNGKKDGLWTDFYENDTVKEIDYYKNGNRDSVWYFYENGIIEETGCFKNGKPDGLWTGFYENGNVKLKAEYVDGKLSGQRYYFSIDGDTLFPKLIKPKLVLNNPSIKNKTDLKIYQLLDEPYILESLIDNLHKARFNICLNDYLTIDIKENVNLKITPDGTLFYLQFDTICNQKIKVNVFTINYDMSRLRSKLGGKKEHFKSSFGKIKVHRKRLCRDTGRNPFKIVRKGKTLSFNDIGNLIFFEFDSDNDGKNELYILTYFSCKGRLEFYKIDDK